jgi:hypothetical protein
VLLAVDLVVGAGCEVGVGRRVLGLYGVAEVVQGGVGGYGCGRDVIEQTLKAQGRWLRDEGAFGW